MGKEMQQRSLRTRRDVEDYLMITVGPKQIGAAKKVLDEWNSENPGDQINPMVLLKNPKLAAYEQLINETFAPPRTTSTAGTVDVGAGDEDLAAAIESMQELIEVMTAFINRQRDFDADFMAVPPNGTLTGKADKLLIEATTVMNSTKLIIINDDGTCANVTRLAADFSKLRDRALPGGDLQ